MSAKNLDQMARGKTSDGLLANHNATTMATNGGTGLSGRSSSTAAAGAMPGPGTLPPKASLSGL